MAQMDRRLRDRKSEGLTSLGFRGRKWNNYEVLFTSLSPISERAYRAAGMKLPAFLKGRARNCVGGRRACGASGCGLGRWATSTAEPVQRAAFCAKHIQGVDGHFAS